MDTPEPAEPSRVEREIEIIGLKREAAEAAGGEMTTWEADDASPEVVEGFWRYIVDWESAPWVTHFERLKRVGVTLPPPEELDDEQLPTVLHELADQLAAMRVFVHNADHLSD